MLIFIKVKLLIAFDSEANMDKPQPDLLTRSQNANEGAGGLQASPCMAKRNMLSFAYNYEATTVYL